MQGASEQVWCCAALYKCFKLLTSVDANSFRGGFIEQDWAGWLLLAMQAGATVQAFNRPSSLRFCRSRGVPTPWEARIQSLRSGKMEAVDQLEIVEISDSLIQHFLPTKVPELSHRPVAEQGCIRSTANYCGETQDFYVGLCSVVW